MNSARIAILASLREDVRHIPTADLVTLLDLMTLRVNLSREPELITDIVIDHIAAARPAPDDWPKLRAVVEWMILRPPTSVRWMVGLWEAGIRPVGPVRVEDVDWIDLQRSEPRLMARARAVYRLALGRDLDEEINEVVRRRPDRLDGGAVPHQVEHAVPEPPLTPSPARSSE
jgi:hypothetical protein